MTRVSLYRDRAEPRIVFLKQYVTVDMTDEQLEDIENSAAAIEDTLEWEDLGDATDTDLDPIPHEEFAYFEQVIANMGAEEQASLRNIINNVRALYEHNGPGEIDDWTILEDY